MTARRGGPSIVSGERRAIDGFIATFVNDAGHALTVHRPGPPSIELAILCAEIERRDPSYRMVAYSTPETILTDLSGGRADKIGGYGKAQRQALPEMHALRRAGFLQLAHPRLTSHVNERKRAQERERARIRKAGKR